MFPEVSYSARIELSETEVISVMSVHYPSDPSYVVMWVAYRHDVQRDSAGIIVQYLSCSQEESENGYPCHIDAIEAGVNHYLRAASVERGQCKHQWEGRDGSESYRCAKCGAWMHQTQQVR